MRIERRQGKLLTRPFLLCFAACASQALAFHMYLHLPGFLTQIGADAFAIGLLAGVSSVAAILSRPTMGRMMDVRGRRIVILVGGTLNVVALSLYLTVESMGPWIYFVRMLHGVSQAILFSVFFAFAADIIPANRRTEGIGWFGISGMLPIGMGPTFGDWILSWGDYQDLFAISIALGALSLLISLPMRDQRAASATEHPPRRFIETIRDPALIPLWFIGAVFAIASSGTFIFMKTFVIEEQLGSLGDFFRNYSFAAIAVRVFLGRLPDQLGTKRVFFPALALLAIGLATIPAASATYGLMPVGILCGIGHGYGIPILNSLVITRARESELGAAIAMSTALFDVGFLVGGPLFGAIIEARGYPTMYATSGALLFVGIAVFWIWDRKR